MKILHGIAWYAPESWGGTEQYVSGLATSLARLGETSIVLARGAESAWREYEHQGTRVVRHPHWRAAQQRDELVEWFRSSSADVYHLHSWTPDAGIAEMAAARDAGLATVITVHIPAPVCARGTMMRWGHVACDGEIQERRCAACWMQSHGIAAPAALAIAAVSPRSAPPAILARTRMRHALSARSDMRSRRATLGELSRIADRVVAVCDWLHSALVLNGIPEERIALSRQAVEPAWIEALGAASRSIRDEFVIVCVGRWDPFKGQHVLVEALRHVRNSSVRVRFIAPAPSSPEAAAHRDRVVAMAQGDARVELCTPPGREALAAEFANANLLAVPSQWFETGPLVVLEAKAARLPVLGSNLGGIAELVRPDVHGWLVPPADVRAWARAIEAIADGRLVATRPIEPARTMDDVACEMRDLYDAVLHARTVA